MIQLFLIWAKDKNGASAIEYALLAAGISLAIAATVFIFGDELYATYFEDFPSVLDI